MRATGSPLSYAGVGISISRGFENSWKSLQFKKIGFPTFWPPWHPTYRKLNDRKLEICKLSKFQLRTTLGAPKTRKNEKSKNRSNIQKINKIWRKLSISSGRHLFGRCHLNLHNKLPHSDSLLVLYDQTWSCAWSKYSTWRKNDNGTSEAKWREDCERNGG